VILMGEKTEKIKKEEEEEVLLLRVVVVFKCS
jgi:hypothetical protein